MVNILLALLPKENFQNIAYYSKNAILLDFLKTFADKNSSNLFELTENELKKRTLGNEHFESIIIDSADDFFDDERIILLFKNALQKNRNLIIISKKLDKWDLSEKLEKYGFSDFSTIEESEININLTKKWFTFEQ